MGSGETRAAKLAGFVGLRGRLGHQGSQVVQTKMGNYHADPTHCTRQKIASRSFSMTQTESSACAPPKTSPFFEPSQTFKIGCQLECPAQPRRVSLLQQP